VRKIANELARFSTIQDPHKSPHKAKSDAFLPTSSCGLADFTSCLTKEAVSRRGLMRWNRVILWLVAVALVLLVAHPLLPEKLAVSQPEDRIQTFVHLRSIFQTIWTNFIVPVSGFIDRNIGSIINWPIAFVVISIVFIRSEIGKSFFPEAASRVSSLNIFGLSVELNAQINEFKKENDDLSRILPSVRTRISEDVRSQVNQHDIMKRFSICVKNVSAEIQKKRPDFNPKRSRATVHIEDPLFADQLMQALDYVDGNGELLPSRSLGRTFSIRRGIVGRAWRSDIPEIAGVLPETLTASTKDEKVAYIAQIWGMTRAEAENAESYPSYVSIPFKYGGSNNAVFYMDSRSKNAFPTEEGAERKDIIEFIKAALSDNHIDVAMASLVGGIPNAFQRIKSTEWAGDK
jgi:hypothetical protein